MNSNGRGESAVSEDYDCRIRDSREINFDSPILLEVDPFQRLKQHLSSFNNRSFAVNKKRKLMSPHDENPIVIDFQDKNAFHDVLTAAKICLEKEECSKETASSFYSLIQNVMEHVNYIKEQNDDNIQKVNKIKLDLIDFNQKALDVCDKINTILTLSYSETVWDHLTKSQKENIKHFQKLFGTLYKELNCSLRKDINVPVDSVALSNPNKKVRCITLSKQHQELCTERNKLLTELAIVKEKHAKLKEASSEIDAPSSHCQNQARLIAILSPFLYVHRLNGQSFAEISSYFKSLGYHNNEQEIENILRSFPSLFRECQSSEHTARNRWIFCGCDL